MNAHIEALKDERKHLEDMRSKLHAGLPINLLIDSRPISQEAMEKARWGIYSGLGARLHELDRLIHELEKEQL